MLGPVTTSALDPILRVVSRSIFITLQIAPAAMRRTLGIAYLFCRAADTIADTTLLPRESRVGSLALFREQLKGPLWSDAALTQIASSVGPSQAIPEEKVLLEHLGACFAAYGSLPEVDQGLIRRLVTTLTRGMELDLERFPLESSGEIAALSSDGELDEYTYYVAGCVGEFWTDLQMMKISSLRSWDAARMREKGVRFGKALQMTNILRDVEKDLALGRVYFPRPRLERAGAALQRLKVGEDRDRLKPVLMDLLRITLDHYEAAWEYTLAIPRRVPRLRLACALPLLIGLRTLSLLAAAPQPYARGAHHKISRREVRSLLARASLRLCSNRALSRLYADLRAQITLG